MASSGAWYREGTVTVTNGSASITGVNTDWLTALIAVAIGDIFTVDSKTWYEIVNVSADTGITLDRNFEGATVAGVNYAIIRNTSGTVLTRIAGQVAVQFNQKQLFLDELRTWLNSTNATEMVTDSHGVSTAITTPTQMASEHSARVAQVDTLVNGISAMTKAEFFALAEQRKSQSAGSGFSEWGNHYSASGVYDINDGMWADNAPLPNALNFGFEGGIISKSRTKEPILNINGHLLHFKSAVERFTAKFPTAPDGTKTYDSSTGTVTQHASAAIAFAAETATNKVITSRQDFVFIEPWHEKISDKGVVYPLGNVQYGGTTYEGITLAVNGIAQGYSAFGEWDSTTTGNCAVWANLTDAQKAAFIQDHKNNIYSDNGELIQVRYRVRVVEGLGDDWEQYKPNVSSLFRFDGKAYIIQRGGLTSNIDFSSSFDWGNAYVGNGASTAAYPVNGQYSPHNSMSNTDKAHNGLCFAIPIALVQRRNQGAYHPVWNPEGCASWMDTSTGINSLRWNSSNMDEITSKSQAFNRVNYNVTGTIGFRDGTGGIADTITHSGRTHDGKFYDAIYASDVFDLRMSAKKLPLKEIREKYKRMAIAGEVRGFEGVPFTYATFNDDTWKGTGGGGSSGRFAYLSSLRKPEMVSMQNSFLKGYPVYLVVSGVVCRVTQIILSNTNPLGNFMYFEQLDGSLAPAPAADSPVAGVYCDDQTHHQANPTWTDIIGSPENIAATFPDGVEGQWIPVIPDGTNDYFPLNRKGINSGKASREYTNDNGSSWTSHTLLTFDDIGNITQFDNMPVTQVMLYHYETQAHFTSDDVNSEVLDLGGVTAINTSDIRVGTILESSLISKIGVSSLGVDKCHEYNLGSIAIWAPTGAIELSSILPSHEAIQLTSASPAVKTLDYLSHTNNVAKLCYAYKEMVYDNNADNGVDAAQQPDNAAQETREKGDIVRVNAGANPPSISNPGVWVVLVNPHGYGSFSDTRWTEFNGQLLWENGIAVFKRWDGNGWGDNNQFEIASNQNTLTDDNGNTVLYGTASFDTQYFISEE